jgi:hypothetical protein
MMLTLKNARNIVTERFNSLSVAKTIDYELALNPLYAYSDEEKELMSADSAFAAKVGPLPLHIMQHIAAEKVESARADTSERKAREVERAEKEAEKQKLASLTPIF